MIFASVSPLRACFTHGAVCGNHKALWPMHAIRAVRRWRLANYKIYSLHMPKSFDLQGGTVWQDFWLRLRSGAPADCACTMLLIECFVFDTRCAVCEANTQRGHGSKNHSRSNLSALCTYNWEQLSGQHLQLWQDTRKRKRLRIHLGKMVSPPILNIMQYTGTPDDMEEEPGPDHITQSYQASTGGELSSTWRDSKYISRSPSHDNKPK